MTRPCRAVLSPETDGTVGVKGVFLVDLRAGAPRSPYATLGGVQFLPRSIDKMRAEIAGT